MMKPRYALHGPGEGVNYDWQNDHTFVKVSAADTGAAYTLMEDNLKPGFELGLHRHDTHAETFYILEGQIVFYVDGDWHDLGPNTTLHVPPGVPHGCRAPDGGRMLMIYQPSGFDGFLAEMARMEPRDFDDPARMALLSAKYDIVDMGPLPERTA